MVNFSNLQNKFFNTPYKRIATITIVALVVAITVLKVSIRPYSPASSNTPYKTQLPLASQDLQDSADPSPSPSSLSSTKKSGATSNNASNTTENDNAINDSGDGNIDGDDSSDDSQDDSDNDSDQSNPTPVPTAESASAYVAFYADSQSDTDEEDARHQKVVNEILSSGANPVFHGGDVMEDGMQNSLDRFNAVSATLRSSRSFYSALGNNDRKIGDATTPSQLFLDNFSFPNNERWYSINSGNLHIVVLDSAFCSSCQSQIDWLVSDLQSSASQSRITGVIYHHPSFSSTLSLYLENNGVDFVIQGHEHVYRHTTSGGIHYFVMPGGGSLGYALASIYSSRVAITFYNENGSVIDSASFDER